MKSPARIGPVVLAIFFLLALTRSSAQPQWTLRNPVPTRKPLTSAIWVEDRLVADFSGSTFATADGLHWETASPLPHPEYAPYSVVKADSSNFGLGGGATVLVSQDSLTWEPIRSGQGPALRSLAWTGSQLVAVGDGGTIITSPDGSAWTARNPGVATDLIYVRWSGSRLEVVDDAANLLASADGIAWNMLASDFPCNANYVFWTGSGTIATCANAGTLSRPLISRHAAGEAFNAFAASDSTIVAVGGSGLIATLSRSALPSSLFPRKARAFQGRLGRSPLGDTLAGTGRYSLPDIPIRA